MTMKSMDITRRQFLKGTGALIVSFNLFPSISSVFAQSNLLPNGDLDPAQLDSWLAIAQDGTVTLFTSKVDLGTGIVTALAQIAAEELDVSWKQIKVIQGDTALTVDQSATGGSRTVERAGPQVRQAAAAARQELMRLAAARLGVDADKLKVKDGIVAALDNPSKKTTYGQLVGGKKFNIKITAQGAAAELKLAQDVKPKNRQGISNRRHYRAALRHSAETHRRSNLYQRSAHPRHAAGPRRPAADDQHRSARYRRSLD